MVLRQEQTVQKTCGSVTHWGHPDMVTLTEDLQAPSEQLLVMLETHIALKDFGTLRMYTECEGLEVDALALLGLHA